MHDSWLWTTDNQNEYIVRSDIKY